MRRSLLLGLAAFCALGSAIAEPAAHWQPVQWGGGGRFDAEGERGDGRRWGPDDARAGVRAGQLRSLDEIIGELQARFGGRLLGQELAEEGGRRVYHIRWMTADGRRLDLTVPAER